MLERRRGERRKPSAEERLLTVHGTRGHICGRAEDESDGGLGVRVRSTNGLAVGQIVLVHRMHEQRLWMGTIRYMSPQDEQGVRIGIELLGDNASKLDLFDLEEY